MIPKQFYLYIYKNKTTETHHGKNPSVPGFKTSLIPNLVLKNKDIFKVRYETRSQCFLWRNVTHWSGVLIACFWNFDGIYLIVHSL